MHDKRGESVTPVCDAASACSLSSVSKKLRRLSALVATMQHVSFCPAVSSAQAEDGNTETESRDGARLHVFSYRLLEASDDDDADAK